MSTDEINGLLKTLKLSGNEKIRCTDDIDEKNKIANIKLNRTAICKTCCIVITSEELNNIGTTAVTIVQTRTSVSSLNQGLFRNLMTGRK